MANLKDLIVNGAARIIGKVYSSGGFVGNLEGNCSGSSASCTGNAATATQVKTTASTDSSTLYPVFVDSNNSTATAESVYSNANLKYVPSTGTLTATTFSGALSGNANTATKLGTETVGGTTTPIYLNTGTPTALNYTIAKSVPSNAVFTDINVTSKVSNTTKAYLVASSSGSDSTGTLIKDTAVYLDTTAGKLVTGSVTGAVWNDLADSIPVDDNCILEYGYCYCFDGEKYNKSSKYMEDGIIGIHSDTYCFQMGREDDKKKMDVAVAGFALAYVDKEYPPGTPLTCTENGYLTEIKKQDKIEYPEKIVATYWKGEPNEEWGTEERKVKVNGRKWVKIR